MKFLAPALMPLVMLAFQQQKPPGDPFNQIPAYACEDCHIPESWGIIQLSRFTHEMTDFPLRGQHRSADCRSCHSGTDYASVHKFDRAESGCFSCHQDIHRDQLGNDCGECHGEDSWRVQQARFEHEDTQFPLIGPHRPIACESCHKADGNQAIAGLPLDCYGCHRMNYDEALTPPHLLAGFPIDCQRCHPVRAEKWSPASFSHSNEQTGFPLEGMHRTVTCDGCHPEERYAGIPSDCGANSPCHLDDFSSTLNVPNHLTYGYPVDFCRFCHTPEGWIPDSYDHAPVTTCRTCHIPDYDATTDPPHLKSNGFTTECETCHTGTTDWADATFDHTNISSSCVTCHQSDYNNTTKPSHQTAGLSTDCAACHNTLDWNNAIFDHGFYTLSGKHANLSCGECHSQPDYRPSCWTCHRDDFFKEHNSGDNANCWECHTTKEWEDDDFQQNIKEKNHKLRRHKALPRRFNDMPNSPMTQTKVSLIR